MAYNTKELVRDKNDNPISQYYNPTTDAYEPVIGSGGGNNVILYNADGTENNELSLIPILDRLSQLTGTVIDEETRKNNEILREDNEVTRVSLYDDLLIQLSSIEQITEQVPQSILDELTVILGKLGGLESLTTTEKANLVGAINEVKQQSNDIATVELPKKMNKTGDVLSGVYQHNLRVFRGVLTHRNAQAYANGIKIKTNITNNVSTMISLKLWGYSYASNMPFELNLQFYPVFNLTYGIGAISNSTGFKPELKVAVENNKIVVFVNNKEVNLAFNVDVIFSGDASITPSFLNNWTVVDELLSETATDVRTIPYR